MKGKLTKRIKLLITLAIIGGFVWFLVLSPMITFRQNEKALEEAGRRYFELNTNELPTGTRVKTVTLKTLYHKSYIEKDLFIPYSKKNCSVENSWVKVKRDNGEFKYYSYLDCGVLSSNIDHKGPEIKLNGEDEVTVGKGENFTDPGVKSVVDNADGKLDIESVTIKGDVDTSKVGTYEIKYSALDSLSNKGVVTRVVKVVQKLNSTVKSELNGSSNYVGEPNNNYVRLSNMLYRIYGLDEKNNVILVQDEDVANVNYSKIDDWLEYYYEHLNDKTKKMIVESKYCNMTVSDTTLDITSCSSYTDKKKIYVPSIVEVNKAEGNGNFMKPSTMSWLANSKSEKEAYIIRNHFNGEDADKVSISMPIINNYGIRPMMTIKGDTLIEGGIGTRSDPYTFGDTKRGKGGSLVNERGTGEYISDGTTLWRIIDVLNDGTTKVISCYTVTAVGERIEFATDDSSTKIEYNPKNKKSVGYFINNTVSRYVDTTNLVNHEIQVPIYKKDFIYGEEVDTKTYKAVLSAPNMYEMFSAQTNNLTGHISHSYWLINTSKYDYVGAAIFDVGVPVDIQLLPYSSFGIRVVGYLKSTAVIRSGNGTFESPYLIK